jgi:hypothetical protein
MFGEQFYPTPEGVIELMLAPYRTGRYNDYGLRDLTILEPSAGKGDIAEFITDKESRVQIDCIEIDPDLQNVLRGKRLSVVGTDFLKFVPDANYDLILMNPPFSNGDEHLLHAWDIAGNTDIVCILNANTIRNANTKRRQLLYSIICEHGTVEYHSDTFTQAERKTGVEIAIVRLKKKLAANEDPFFIGLDKEEAFTDFDENSIETGLMIPDAIRDYVAMYQRSRAELIVLCKSLAKLDMLTKPLLSDSFHLEHFLKDEISSNPKKMFNSVSKKLSARAWNNIFSKTKLEKYMTSTVRANFHNYTSSQGQMAFTEDNIKAVFEMLFVNRISILETALLDVFETMTKYHDDNRVHVEGWKTNDAFKVNRKVIVPWFIEFDNKYNQDKSGKFRIGYHRKSQFEDIDKALCLITGDRHESIYTSIEVLETKFERLGTIRLGDSFDNTCSSHFFDFKFWKKGTLHMTFRDPWVWEQFNMHVASKRNWLPDRYSNKYKPTGKYPILHNVL